MALPSPCDLTGVWEGTSSSRADDPTEWRHTVLLFLPCSSGPRNSLLYEVLGKGVSLWRSLEIDFTINGTLDPRTKAFTLNKVHQGKYTNTVQYSGTLSLESSSSSPHPSYLLTGVYSTGVITLSQSSRGPLSAVCSLLSLPPWRGCSISNTLDETAWEDVTLNLTPANGADELRAGLRGEDGGRLAGDEERAVRLASGALGGGGGGGGVSLSPRRLPDESQGLVALISGSGVSLWRSLRIQFYLRGTLDLASGVCRLEKEHRGRYSNIIKYVGELDRECCIAGRYDMGRIELRCGPNDGAWRGFHGRLFRLAMGLATGDRADEREPEVDGRSGGEEQEDEEEDDDEGEEQEDMEDRNRDSRRFEESKDARTVASRGGGGNGSGSGGGASRKVTEEKKARDEAKDENDLCKICFVNKINTVIIPCGHFCSCLDCGRRLDTECPICRGAIAKVQEVFRA